MLILPCYNLQQLVQLIQEILLDGVPIMHHQECVCHVEIINYNCKPHRHVNVLNYIPKQIVKIQDFVLSMLKPKYVKHHHVKIIIIKLLVLH